MSPGAGRSSRLAATTIQTSRVLQGFCFQSTSNGRRRDVLRDSHKNKKKNPHCVPERWQLQIRFLLFRHHQGCFLRLSSLGCLGWWGTGEGWAEIGDEADGSRNLSAQVSLFYLNRPVQLHWGEAASAAEPTHERELESEAQLAAGWVNNMLM